MITLVRAEWLKLRTVVGNIVLLALSVALPIGFSILIPLILRKDQLGDVTRNDLFSLALAGLSIAQALVKSRRLYAFNASAFVLTILPSECREMEVAVRFVHRA